MNNKNPLLGKTITDIQLTSDGSAIKFVLDDNTEIVAICDADCCSHTWIEEVVNPSHALNSPVIIAEDVDLPEEFRQPTTTGHYEEEMAYYGFVIDTLFGRCTIAYRNSSNGYYGGNLSWPNSYFYGGVYGQNRPGDDFKTIIGE